jgi:hypothetical protein
LGPALGLFAGQGPFHQVYASSSLGTNAELHVCATWELKGETKVLLHRKVGPALGPRLEILGLEELPVCLSRQLMNSLG